MRSGCENHSLQTGGGWGLHFQQCEISTQTSQIRQEHTGTLVSHLTGLLHALDDFPSRLRSE